MPGKLVKQREFGVTLVELLIVIVMISILAGVGFPLYSGYVMKTRRIDARIGLERIALAQERYNAVKGSYSSDLGLLNMRGDFDINAKDKSRATSESGFYTLAVTVPASNTSTFTLVAIPVAGKSQANDSDCTTLTLNHLGVHGGTGDDADECW
ncbi:MAG: type IV pilin protein [Candidatus Sedimenticola sp. PURPLELP]